MGTKSPTLSGGGRQNMGVELSLPQNLLAEVAQGSVALFFGAGSSRGAVHTDGVSEMPLADGLRDDLADEFLQGDSKDRQLSEVVGFIENEGGPLRMETFIAKKMRAFSPSPGHLLLPKFRWQAFYSLNYDLLIEDAYKVEGGLQTLHPIHKSEQSIDRLLRDNPGSLPLYKLHGCIDRLNDPTAPLILSQDSYLVWHKNRERLYSRLRDSVAEYSVVFIGTTLADPHIRQLLSEASSRRPMQYIVSPGLTERDSALFASKRITPIKATFDEFMVALNAGVPDLERRLRAAAPLPSEPIARHFSRNVPVPPNVSALLDNNVDFVHAALPTKAVSPQVFYKGESQSWSPIEQNLDIRRTAYEPFMLKLLSLGEADDANLAVMALRGVAGSGKTVFLRRAAYDLATEFGFLTLFAPPRANLRPEPFRELWELTGKRVVLFVDQAADQMGRIAEVVSRLRAWEVPITIVLGDTRAAFGNSLEDLGEDLKFIYDLRQLSHAEIEALIAKLEEHRSLGVLAPASPTERIESFTKVADRQLLVALYEATQGKPLEDILLEEYNRIALIEAQDLYLVVCALHQYKVPVRAGLIRRVTGIDFNDFESRLLGPLEDIVFAVKDPISRDWSFRARHSQIASIVFRTVLDTNSKRVSHITRIMKQMDISYSSDADAMRQMINYKNIRDLTPVLSNRRDLLELAEDVTRGEPFALQQRALLEMNDPKGSLTTAEEYLDRAQALRPYDRSLKHTRAGLLLRKARTLTSDLSRKAARNEARGLLKSVGEVEDPYVASTTAQLVVDEIADRLASPNEASEGGDAQLLRLVEDAERAIRSGLSRAPDFESLTITASRLHELLGHDARAIQTLKRSIEKTPQLEFVAVAYAKAIRHTDLAAAIETIRRSLVHRPFSRPLNQALFELLLLEADDAREDLLVPLRRSFTDDDNNLSMHIHMLRYHFLKQDKASFEEARDKAKKLRLPIGEKQKPRFPYRNAAAEDGRFEATVVGSGETFVFIRIAGMAADVFCRAGIGSDIEVWDELRNGKRVRVALQFSAFGAVGTDLEVIA